MKFKNYKIKIILAIFILNVNLYANIDGLRIEIVDANMYGKIHIPLVDKRIDVNKDIFRLGYLQTGKSTKKLIKENEFYVVSIQNKYSKGKVNAIVKGEYLRSNPYNMGALTQVVFLLLENLLGSNYET